MGGRRNGHPGFPVRESPYHPDLQPVQSAAQGENLVNDVTQHFTPFRVTRAAGGAALAALAVAVAWFGIRINAWYGGTLGRNSEASTLLSGLSVLADVLALILPTAARTLWTDRRRMAAAVAWTLWTITVAVALMATVELHHGLWPQ